MATTNLTPLSHSLSHSHSHSLTTPRYFPSLYSHSPSLSLSLSSIFFPFRQTTQFPATPKPLLKPRSLPRLFATPKLSDSPSFPLSPDTDPATGDLTTDPGVYAVFDGNNEVQFIGLARNVATSVGVHLNKVPQLCSKVKVGVIDQPDRESLTQAWKSWMEEHIAATGKIPPGNETGNTTWFRPPPQKKRDLRLTPGGNKQLTVPLEELVDKLVKENKVVAFIKGSRSAPQCGFSQRVVGILDSQGVDYESVDVLDDEYNPGLRETLKNYSNWPTFPQVFVKGELVGGCDILTSMNENGELAGLFKE